MKPPLQASLFDQGQTSASTAELLRIDQGRAALNPAQRTFNRLTEQIERARTALARWEAVAERLHQRVGVEIQPVLAAISALQRQLIEQVDAMLTHPPVGLKLTRRRREALIEFLLERIDDSLTSAADEALEALHDQYSDISLQQRREIEQGVNLEFAEHMVSGLFGDELIKDHGAESMDELLQRVDERLAESFAAEQQEREAQAGKRKSTRRQAAAEARRAEEALAVGQSMRDVYRKLVSSLHPDRESDPDERVRKTALMKDINRAYEANDLLSLLSLQMEVEQINPATLAALPAQRMQHYNEVLREQLRALNEEIATRSEQLLLALGGETGKPLRDPKEAELLLDSRVREMHDTRARFTSTIAALANPHLRIAEIDAIARAMARF